MNKEDLDFLIWLEEQMDNYNGNYGTIDNLCCFCKAAKYNSQCGIVHNEVCPVMQLRQRIIDAQVSKEVKEC